MQLAKEEIENIKEIMHHMNDNHLCDDGLPEKEWTEDDVIYVAIKEGIERIMIRHGLRHLN